MREYYFMDTETSGYHVFIVDNAENISPLTWYVNTVAFMRVRFGKPPYYLASNNEINSSKILVLDELKVVNKSTKLPEPLYRVLSEDMKKKEQERLLNRLSISGNQFRLLFDQADLLGYKLSVFFHYKYPEDFVVGSPSLMVQNYGKTVRVHGDTSWTDGKIAAALSQTDVYFALLFIKDTKWHCFYSTRRGLSGQEHGILLGDKPHLHYLSDKSNKTIREIKQCIDAGSMPASKVHILLSDYIGEKFFIAKDLL